MQLYPLRQKLHRLPYRDLGIVQRVEEHLLVWLKIKDYPFRFFSGALGLSCDLPEDFGAFVVVQIPSRVVGRFLISLTDLPC